jgi:hypothetical protein
LRRLQPEVLKVRLKAAVLGQFLAAKASVFHTQKGTTTILEEV